MAQNRFPCLKTPCPAGKNHSEVVIFNPKKHGNKKTNKGGRPALADPAKTSPCPLPERPGERPLPLAMGAVGRYEQVPFHRRPVVRRAVPGGESGQVGGRVLRPADRILCPVQSGGGQLQPSGKGVAQQFSEKKALAFSINWRKRPPNWRLNRQVIDLTNECKELWLPK